MYSFLIEFALSSQSSTSENSSSSKSYGYPSNSLSSQGGSLTLQAGLNASSLETRRDLSVVNWGGNMSDTAVSLPETLLSYSSLV